MILGLWGGALYTGKVNPANALRQRWIEAKQTALERTAGKPRLLVCGDSSVLFGIKPSVLQRVTGVPAVNLGYTAGCGALVLLGAGDAAARTGDVLVLSFSPDLLSPKTLQPEDEGRLFAVTSGHPEIVAGGREPLIPMGVMERTRNTLSYCSPGERLLLNDLGRRLLRMPAHRYIDCPIDADGYATDVVIQPHEPCRKTLPASPAWRRALPLYAQRVRARGVKIFFTMPWLECTAADIPRVQQETGLVLEQISESMPVLPEENFGLKTDSALFADTFAHLTSAGATVRSEALGRALLAALGRVAVP